MIELGDTNNIHNNNDKLSVIEKLFRIGVVIRMQCNYVDSNNVKI